MNYILATAQGRCFGAGHDTWHICRAIFAPCTSQRRPMTGLPTSCTIEKSVCSCPKTIASRAEGKYVGRQVCMYF